jgi:large subunit ribosomal protein L29
MKSNKRSSDLRAMDGAGLKKELDSLLRAQFSLRMQVATQQLANNSQLGKTRHDIARVRTVMREQQLKAGK